MHRPKAGAASLAAVVTPTCAGFSLIAGLMVSSAGGAARAEEPSRPAFLQLSKMAAGTVPATSQNPRRFRGTAVYGEDDRRDVYQVTDARLLRLADSTVALFDADSTAPDAGESVALKTKPLGARETAPVCSDERFYGQPVGAFCSGFLIGPDLVMTAAHCADASLGFPVPECSRMRIVFGFSLRGGGKSPTSLPAGEVYRCVELVARPEDWLDEDWTIIRLDRAVTGHEALRLNAAGGLRPGTTVFAAGHPAGLPTKITGPAKVVSVDAKTFRTDLDIFNGNSGGPVINAETGLVEGVVSEGGGPDYLPRGHGECWESNRLRDGDATRLWGAVAAKVPRSPVRRSLQP